MLTHLKRFFLPPPQRELGATGRADELCWVRVVPHVGRGQEKFNEVNPFFSQLAPWVQGFSLIKYLFILTTRGTRTHTPTFLMTDDFYFTMTFRKLRSWYSTNVIYKFAIDEIDICKLGLKTVNSFELFFGEREWQGRGEHRVEQDSWDMMSYDAL